MKTTCQGYSGVRCSYSLAPAVVACCYDYFEYYYSGVSYLKSFQQYRLLEPQGRGVLL